jgi:hypothetical protein
MVNSWYSPLMAEFFDRGPKLTDQSNRYEQTCKRCKEHLIRGRTEAMIAHLTKKCPNVTRQEKAVIILRLHDIATPDIPITNGLIFEPAQLSATFAANQDGSSQAVTSGTEVQLDHQLDGLIALAEASHRVNRDQPDATESFTSPVYDMQAPGIATSSAMSSFEDNRLPSSPLRGVPLDPQLRSGAYACSGCKPSLIHHLHDYIANLYQHRLTPLSCQAPLTPSSKMLRTSLQTWLAKALQSLR